MRLCHQGKVADCDFALMLCDEWHHGLVPARFRGGRHVTTPLSRDHIYAYLAGVPVVGFTGSAAAWQCEEGEQGEVVEAAAAAPTDASDDDEGDGEGDANALRGVPTLISRTLGNALDVGAVAKFYLYQYDAKSLSIQAGAGDTASTAVNDRTIAWWLRDVLDGRFKHKLALQGLVFSPGEENDARQAARSHCPRVRRGRRDCANRKLLEPNEPCKLEQAAASRSSRRAERAGVAAFQTGDLDVLVGDNIHATGLDALPSTC